MRPRNDSYSSAYSADSTASSGTCTSDTSLDEDDDDHNVRVTPHWPRYRAIIQRRGFRLDTLRDVRAYYECYLEDRRMRGLDPSGGSGLRHSDGYSRACKAANNDDNALCRDAGLRDSLFRGTRVHDGKKIIVKAVHLRSREFSVIRMLSSPPLRDDPLNHTIPVLDLIAVPEDDIGFIVMEEWSPQLLCSTPCSLRGLLRALRQCIEGLVFLHSHRIAHLDISPRNVVTDYNGRYSYIDFEMSRQFDPPSSISPPSSRNATSQQHYSSHQHHQLPQKANRLSMPPPPSPPADCTRGGDCGLVSRGMYVPHPSSHAPSAGRCPRVRGCRGTEIPPDVERGAESCPFKVDVWALGVLILRACQMTGYDVPELVMLTQPMLHDSGDERPTARAVLHTFDRLVSRIPESRLRGSGIHIDGP